ncbi:hypothetical protein C2845_PM05G30850 [Panicum miliaceum]|uniref:Uncharacterized protein n=1 Tax=Panicum miliaceum TaxID=4540 RepID=A0A3L6T0A0_PANMI|nr:hypothetical protein C2845_PM05G30850 [Panicum miliaceum]
MEDTSRLKCLCSVLGLDSKKILQDQVDGSVDNIDNWVEDGLSDKITNCLASAVHELSKIKSERFIQLKEMASRMVLYWSVLSTHLQENCDFLSILHYAEVEAEAKITEYHALSVDSIQAVEKELGRLEKQMDDLISKKKSKLDQIFQRTHLKPTSVGTGFSDSYTAFEQLKLEISKAKTLSSIRNDMVTRIELLQSVNEEIAWSLNSNFSTEIDVSKIANKMEEIWISRQQEDHNGLLGIGSRGRDDPIDLDVEAVDITQLAIPRKRRTKMEIVQPLPPPPPLQVMSDGDDSMASGGNCSDPNDPGYDPGDSNESG